MNIKVNFEKTLGKVKPMHAVNNMPTAPLNSASWDERMTAAHIPYGRLHDTGGPFGGTHYVDIPNIFPNFDADVNDPASYDFAFTDALLSRMVASGVMPYYRLGVTIENYHAIKPYNIYPPKDYKKWAEICEHVILHYNYGWADGFEFGIEYWEIWNEPDNYPDIEDNCMWRGTMEQYFELYEVAASHLKAKFPHLKIGGYASCGFYAMNNVDVSNIAHSTSRTDYFIEFFIRFLEYISERKLPLDFFGWHSYAGIADNIKFAYFPREQLDRFGYTDCEIHLNEWNPGTAQRGKLRDASNILSMMLALHDTPTDMLMYYDSRYWSSYCGYVNPINMTPFKAYYAFFTFGRLFALGTRVEVDVEGENLYAMAATDGESKAMVIVNHSDADATFALDGLPTGARFYLVDESHDCEEVALDASSVTLPANAILFVEA